MCGIAGIISQNTSLVQQQKLQGMANALQHRGQDGEDTWINNENTAGFAHRRLSIIDLSNAASQPMHYKDRYTIVFNGEIYNYIELRDQLKKEGYQFTTSSDTEVILAAYDFYNDECVEHFDGMFAFAIWDNDYQQLFAARDRFGEKPFYYFIDDEQFVFASEMKALFAIGIAKESNNTMLLNYLTLGFTSDASNPEATFYNNILKLPPASKLYFSFDDILVVEKYWDIDKEEQINSSEVEAIEKFQHLFNRSLQRRLRSDVAIGTSLSGGLDSSSIIASICKTTAQRPNSFSAIFPGFEKDESKYIAEVAYKFNIQNFTVTPTAQDFLADFDKLLYHQEEPFQSASIYAQYKVYELAKQHNVTVLLDGQGADEMLAGYHKYYHWYWQELLANYKLGLTKKEIAAARNIGVAQPWDFKNYAAAFLPSYTAKQLEKRVFKQQQTNPDITFEFFENNYNKETLYKPVVEKLNDMLYFNSLQFGLEELLRYADRNSMAHGREVRLPFLDHELVQFIFSLPSHFKIKDGFTKHILRASMNTVLPKDIVWRKDKTGFEPPQQQWLQHKQVQERTQESKRALVNKGILNKEVLNKPLQFSTAHEADGFDWRYLCAGKTFEV